MKTTKRLAKRPETQSYPENRFGTRSFTNLVKMMSRESGIVGLSKLLRSRPRMQKKVIRLISEGKPIPSQGKIVRAAYRDMLTAFTPAR
jgi:hypothetical protein